jgi:hypothetical protein
MSVGFGGRSSTFQSSGTTAVAQILHESCAMLTFVDAKDSTGVIYTYTANDGTVVTFRPLGNGDCATRRCAYPAQIV